VLRRPRQSDKIESLRGKVASLPSPDRAAAEKCDETEARFRAEVTAKEENIENLQSINAIIEQPAVVRSSSTWR
jgi:hypothetical protein